MVVRIRFAPGAQVERRSGKNSGIVHGFGALLTPGSAMVASLGLWRLAADLKWTEEFIINKGLFSHWQVWLASAAALQLCSRKLNRYGRQHDSATSGTS